MRAAVWKPWSATTWVMITLAAIVAIGIWYGSRRGYDEKPHAAAGLTAPTSEVKHTPAPEVELATMIEFPEDSWPAAGIVMESVAPGSFTQTVDLTGKIALNEDRIAHIFPLVEGRVDEVKVQLGDKVEAGELLVVVQSREVGQAMLQLFQDRLQRDFASTNDRWTQQVAANTQEMIRLLRKQATIEEIEEQLADRPLGDYRGKLMSAYIASQKAKKNLDRVSPLSESGAVTGKQMLEAESEWNATRATLLSLLEQFQQETKQAAKLSQQSVKELETRVAIDETNLKILGFDEEALATVAPRQQGEAISHYPIRAPFAGTILSKDVALLERVSPESQLLSVADLSTVWVSTDIYEEHIPLLKQLENQTLTFRSPAWPGKTFTAKIFYTGDLVHEASRTVTMRAIADNREGLLKPGAFVNVELPSLQQSDVLRIPLTALQEHTGQPFVFVHLQGDEFERRAVTLGARNAQHVVIATGLKPGDKLVTGGAFALKSQMLVELLSE